MNKSEILNWLLNSDPSIRYQVNRDLLNKNLPELQEQIAKQGWGKILLNKRKPEGHWGDRFYQPKWISSHYTLLDLRNLCISPNNEIIKESIELILKNDKGPDGGINPIGTVKLSDVCINGMFLNYASYFKADQSDLSSVADCILRELMPDGGFNCQSNRKGAKHSSLHTTISVLEGIQEYENNGYKYRLNDLMKAKLSSIEFILNHRFFISDRTGEIINKEFLKLSYPYRWKYNILRALDFFQYAEVEWDDRMQEAIDVLIKNRKNDNRWKLQAHHPGKRHLDMEKVGESSRWNTLIAMRVLKFYDIN